MFLDGLGSLTLGNIQGGMVNTQIDVTARTNLVVAAGATVNSGTSTLSLGADLNPDGTGNDGVGTLSILAGAAGHLEQSHRQRHHAPRGGHQHRHQRQPGPRGGSATLLSTTPTATLTGLNGPRRPGLRHQRQPLRGQHGTAAR